MRHADVQGNKHHATEVNMYLHKLHMHPIF